MVKEELMDRLQELEKKMLDKYVGYNVIRCWFREKEDAKAYLDLMTESGKAYEYTFYGATMAPGIEASRFQDEPAWEVLYG